MTSPLQSNLILFWEGQPYCCLRGGGLFCLEPNHLRRCKNPVRLVPRPRVSPCTLNLPLMFPLNWATISSEIVRRVTYPGQTSQRPGELDFFKATL